MFCPHFDPADWQAKPLSRLVGSSNNMPSTQASQTTAPVNPRLSTPLSPNQRQPAHNLPHSPNLLLGRQQELTWLLQRLSQTATRLVTLTGVGGTGKTRLVLEVGKQYLNQFHPDGVYFVNLVNVTRRESLVAEIAVTLKVPQTTGHDLLHNLKEFLKDKEILLILDNFEQLVAEGIILSELLREIEHLKLLVTSRVPLHLSFEHEFSVGPLAIPGDEVLLTNSMPDEVIRSYSGVALFVERVQAVKPDFTLTVENVRPVIEICRRVDGLPLALELAAARMRTFSPQKLLERLSLKILTGGARDLPVRQQTLWDTVAWSYDLLSAEEQQLFYRLAIFAGGCTLEAAEAVCNPDEVLTLDVFEGLEILLTRNLLKQWEGPDGQTRYGMLVTIREFGLEKLANSGEAPLLAQRYSDYYLTMTRQHQAGFGETTELAALRRQVEIEYANFIAVLQHNLEGGQTEEALELSLALNAYFSARGYTGEGLQFLEKALALPYPAVLSSAGKAVRGKALFWAGLINFNLGAHDKSRRYIDEALVVQREANDVRGMIFSLNRLSVISSSQGEVALTNRYLAESLDLSQELGEEEYLENTWSLHGKWAIQQGKYEEALGWYSKNLALAQRSGSKLITTHTMLLIGEVEIIQGKYEAARLHLEESLAMFRELDIHWALSITLYYLSLVTLCQGEYNQARDYSIEELALCRKAGLKEGVACSLFIQGLIAFCQKDYKSSYLYFEENLALLQEMGDKNGITGFQYWLGLYATSQGEFLEAHRLYIESLGLYRNSNDKFGLAQVLTGLAELESQRWLKLEQKDSSSSVDNLIRVAHLSGIISALLGSIGAVMYRPFPAIYDQNLALVKANLEPKSFETAFSEGQTMGLDEFFERWGHNFSFNEGS
jgi:predicted ATPase